MSWRCLLSQGARWDQISNDPRPCPGGPQCGGLWAKIGLSMLAHRKCDMRSKCNSKTNGNSAKVEMTGTASASVHSSTFALHERSASQHDRQHTRAYRATVSDIESASAWFAERSTALWVCGNDSRSDFLELKMLEKSSLGDLRECNSAATPHLPRMAVNSSQVDAIYSSSEYRSRPDAPFPGLTIPT
jgi:hypothetical protein